MISAGRHFSTGVLGLHALALVLFGLVVAGPPGHAGGLLVVIGFGVLALSSAAARRIGERGSQGSAAPLVAPPVTEAVSRRADEALV